MEAILKGFLGAGLAALVFLAGALWERRRPAVRQKPPETGQGQETADEAGAANTQAAARAEELRRKQWQEWLNFLYYDGSPSGD
jgi:hypothetical protein